MGDLVKVAVLADFREGRGKAVDLDGVKVAVFRTPGGLVAVSDACLHMGASLADGTLDGHEIECSWHGWRYDVTTGHTTYDPEERLTRYPVQVVDGAILVDVT